MTSGSSRDWTLPPSPPIEPPPAPPGSGGPSGFPPPLSPPLDDGKGTRSVAGRRTMALVGGGAVLALVAGSLGAAIGVILASQAGSGPPRVKPATAPSRGA